MNEPTRREATPRCGQAWEVQLQDIERCSGLQEAVESLIADRANREAIDAGLRRILTRASDCLYEPIPCGLRPGQHEKYREMVQAASIQRAALQALLGILGPENLLDDERIVRAVDRSGMLDRLARWPDHMTVMQEEALRAAGEFKSKHPAWQPRKVQVFGLGGSGAPHDIAAEVVSNFRASPVEIHVIHADEPNPDHTDKDTLAIFSSFSGNTEETLNCYKCVCHRAGAAVSLGQGGTLLQWSKGDGIPFIAIPGDRDHPAYVHQPRESVCLQMTGILTFLAAIGLPAGSDGELTLQTLDIDGAIERVNVWRTQLEPAKPYAGNPAKQLACFLLYGSEEPQLAQGAFPGVRQKRVPFVLADRSIAALAHEVRTQLHERSKVNAACYDAPEFLHNLVESIRATSESSCVGIDDDVWVYYLIRSPDEEARIGVRLTETVNLVMRERSSFATLYADGANPFHRALSVVYFNAHMTTYLAILNGCDPLPVPTMSWMKNVMSDIPRGTAGSSELQPPADGRWLSVHKPGHDSVLANRPG